MRRARAQGGLLFTLAVVLLLVTPAIDSASAKAASFQALLNPDGTGRIFVNNGSSPAWTVCAPDRSSCHPFATGGDVSTNGAPPDVVFRAETHALEEPEWLTPIWLGNVTSVAPPSVSGTVRANELVTPIPGRWQGGWSNDYDRMQLAACKTPTGESCVTLTEPSYPQSCPGEAAVLDPVFSGWYLRVADQRLAADTTFLFSGATTPYGQEVWSQAPTISVSVVGRIDPPLHARTAECGPPPLVRVTLTPSAVARVRCGLGCRASLIATRHGRTASVSRRLRAYSIAAARNVPIPELRLPRRAISRLGRGPARVVVLVNGERTASRTVLLR
jgi:hypothetical protein